MKINEEWCVADLLFPLDISERLMFIKKVLELVNKDVEIYMLLKPLAMRVFLRSVRTRVSLGPLTPVFRSSQKDFVEQHLKQYFKRALKVSDIVWADVFKPQTEVSIVSNNNVLISKLLSAGFKPSESAECVLIEKEDVVDEEKLKQLLYKRFTLFTKSLIAEKEVINISGNPTYYYVNHPLFYGVNLSNNYLRVKSLGLTGKTSKKLGLISLPLLFIDIYPLIYEVQYNKSIVLNFIYEPNDILTYFVISSCFYTCSKIL